MLKHKQLSEAHMEHETIKAVHNCICMSVYEKITDTNATNIDKNLKVKLTGFIASRFFIQLVCLHNISTIANQQSHSQVLLKTRGNSTGHIPLTCNAEISESSRCINLSNNCNRTTTTTTTVLRPFVRNYPGESVPEG